MLSFLLQVTKIPTFLSLKISILRSKCHLLLCLVLSYFALTTKLMTKSDSFIWFQKIKSMLTCLHSIRMSLERKPCKHFLSQNKKKNVFSHFPLQTRLLPVQTPQFLMQSLDIHLITTFCHHGHTVKCNKYWQSSPLLVRNALVRNVM